MTDKELIEAQERDIRNLLNTVRLKNDQIETMKNAAKDYGTEFKFDTPYYRLETKYISCYRLVNIVWHKWHKSMIKPELDLRYSEVWSIRLSDKSKCTGYGGNRVLKSCISYEDLKAKLIRRAKIALNKGNATEVAHWTEVMQMIKEETNKCTAFFAEEVN